MSTSSYDPFKLMSSGIALWADTARIMQAQYMTALTRATEQMPETLDWQALDHPGLSAKFSISEEQLREAFQASASMNMSAWAHMANMLDALPKWTRWHNQVPGRVLTDAFDQMRPRQDRSTRDQDLSSKAP